MILWTTPFQAFAKDYKDKYVLIAGCGEVIEAANSYGFNKAIHQNEYSTLFPNLCPFNSKYRSEEYKQEIFKNLKHRFGDSFDIQKIMSREQKIPISACFSFHDVLESEEAGQLFTDLCISKDGVPGSVLDPLEKQFVKCYISSVDLVWVNDFSLKRFGQGVFKIYFENVFKQCYHRDPEINIYGKPSENTYKYWKSVIDQKAKDQGYEISNYYMIGDNPAADIRGANNFGWKSILVKTGVFNPKHGELNDKDDPAHYVVHNFEEAVNLILKEESVL